MNLQGHLKLTPFYRNSKEIVNLVVIKSPCLQGGTWIKRVAISRPVLGPPSLVLCKKPQNSPKCHQQLRQRRNNTSPPPQRDTTLDLLLEFCKTLQTLGHKQFVRATTLRPPKPFSRSPSCQCRLFLGECVGAEPFPQTRDDSLVTRSD